MFFPSTVVGCFPKIGIPQKWMVYNGKPYWNGWFGGVFPLFSETSSSSLSHRPSPNWFGHRWGPFCGPREAAKPVVSMVPGPAENHQRDGCFPKKNKEKPTGDHGNKPTQRIHFKGHPFFLKISNHTKLHCLIPPMWITGWFLPNETQKWPEWYAPTPRQFEVIPIDTDFLHPSKVFCEVEISQSSLAKIPTITSFII